MIFNDLTPVEMEIVEQSARQIAFTRGLRLVEEKNDGDAFFLIIHGRAEVRKAMDIGKYRRLAELGPCDVFGEICFLGQPTRSASVVALTDGLALEFTRAGFERLVQQYPAIGLKTYRGLARELAQRLARIDEDLRDALLWALNESPPR